MRLVIDTNIIISALIKDSVTRRILADQKFQFVIPEFALSEIDKYKEEIISKSGLNKTNYNLLLTEIMENVDVIPAVEINKVSEAIKIMDHIDPKDTVFIALALSIHNDGIWSDDKHFDQQNKIKVWKTKDLLS